MFNRIGRLKSKLNYYKPLTSDEVSRLREEFLINFIYNSNAIEGNALTLRETALILKEGITIGEKSLKDHLEVVGHKDAFYHVEKLVQNKIDILEKVIKNIHSLILMDKPQYRGTYRRMPVTILGATHELPKPYLVPVLI